jgi:large subunit ribosomal protein L6e
MSTRNKGESRNFALAPGISFHSRGKMFQLKAKWKYLNAVKEGKLSGAKVEKQEKTTEKKVKKFGRKKVDRVIEPKFTAGFVQTSMVRRTKRVKPQNPTKLRESITPGTVLIILAGRFSGKRVVFLKQLPSGLLLVTGPYKLNGVPLRRVSQAYVIATSTKIDISNVKIPESITDETFRKPKTPKSEKKSEEEFFAKKEEKKKTETSEERKKLQQEVDEQILAITKNVEHLDDYLRTPFGLSNGDKPHLMKF